MKIVTDIKEIMYGGALETFIYPGLLIDLVMFMHLILKLRSWKNRSGTVGTSLTVSVGPHCVLV